MKMQASVDPYCTTGPVALAHCCCPGACRACSCMPGHALHPLRSCCPPCLHGPRHAMPRPCGPRMGAACHAGPCRWAPGMLQAHSEHMVAEIRRWDALHGDKDKEKDTLLHQPASVSIDFTPAFARWAQPHAGGCHAHTHQPSVMARRDDGSCRLDTHAIGVCDRPSSEVNGSEHDLPRLAGPHACL